MSYIPFIETQFPVARFRRRATRSARHGAGQTLTGLGKWWGRKPLILVRACILGLLMPASEDPQKDRDIFYKILTMDEDGLWQRKNKPLSAKEIARLVKPEEYQGRIEGSGESARWVKGISKAEKARLEALAFARLPYEEKLTYCCRPEEIEGPSPSAWKDINAHLGTSAHSLEELFAQLSEKAFGHTARVGDCFCGGGSVPFEAARLGLEAYGSDLNPVAVLLTWGAIHLIGGGRKVQEAVRRAQEEVAKASKFASERFAASMLPVKDSLEAALGTPNQTLETLRQGWNSPCASSKTPSRAPNVRQIDPQAKNSTPTCIRRWA